MGSGTPTSSSAQKVFICYRREETAAHAGRLYDAMVARFGERNVFMDVDIAPGVDFVERITEVVSRCLVLIVVMGRSWATVKDEDGNPRIADPDDFVRLEVETGLRRSDVTPIPVLVGGARMPRREDLPPELQPIARRNALELSDARWGYDVGRLNTTLDELLGETSAVEAPITKAEAEVERDVVAERSPRLTLPAGRLLLEAVLVAGLTAFFARYLAGLIPEQDSNVGQVVGIVSRRAVTWALAGAAVAAWLAIRTGRAEPFGPALSGLLIGAIAGAVGGAIWAVPVLLPEIDLINSDLAKARRIELGAIGATGAIFGAMIGARWPSPRPAAGLVCGLLTGALFQLLVIGTGWADEPIPPTFDVALTFGLEAAAIVGATLAILLALDRNAVGASSGLRDLPAPAADRTRG